MGLFSNNKKLCSICGNPTPRIFSTKVEGTPICKECDKKADQLPLGTTDTMTLDQFKAYLDFYEANQPCASCLKRRNVWDSIPSPEI